MFKKREWSYNGEDSDYDDEYEPNYEKTQEQIETARELIKLVEEYMNKKLN